MEIPIPGAAPESTINKVEDKAEQIGQEAAHVAGEVVQEGESFLRRAEEKIEDVLRNPKLGDRVLYRQLATDAVLGFDGGAEPLSAEVVWVNSKTSVNLHIHSNTSAITMFKGSVEHGHGLGQWSWQ